MKRGDYSFEVWCRTCGKIFRADWQTIRYCSDLCRTIGYLRHKGKSKACRLMSLNLNPA